MIRNDGTLEELEAEVRRVIAEVSGRGVRMSRGASPGRKGKRKTVVVAAALAALVGGGVVLATSESVQDRLREVTLPLRHEDIIRQQAKQKDVPPDLIAGIIYAESRFRDQESHAGARGLMQVTPQTAELIEDLSGGSTFVADDLSDPDINIRYGTFYLRYLLDKFDGNLIAALAAYNAGETNVAAWGGAELRAGRHPLRGDERVRGRGPGEAAGIPRALLRGTRPQVARPHLCWRGEVKPVEGRRGGDAVRGCARGGDRRGPCPGCADGRSVLAQGG